MTWLGRSKWILATGLMASVFLLVALAPAWAQDGGEEGLCRDDCRMEHRACFEDERGALQECSQGCEADDRSCRRACFRAFKHEAASCNPPLFECRLDCRDDLDPVCIDVCSAELETCQQGLAACRDDCRITRETAVSACREGDPAELRSCLRKAAHETRQCGRTCREQHHCARDAKECIEGCSDAE
jgi:hypothetical protein